MKGPHDKRGALSLEAMAARAGSHNKAAAIQKQKQKKLVQKMKQKKLLHKLEAGGRAAPRVIQVKDNIAELEHELFTGDASSQPPVQTTRPVKKTKRSQVAAAAQLQPAEHAMDHQQGHHHQLHAAAEGHQQQDGTLAKRPMTAAGMPNKKRKQYAPQQVTGVGDGTGHVDEQAIDQQEQQEQHQPEQLQRRQASRGQKQGPYDQGRPGKSKPHKGRVQQLMEQQQQQREAARQAKQQAQEARAQHQARVKAVQKQRQEEKRHFFKRTRTGQPLMQYRIEKILNQLQHE